MKATKQAPAAPGVQKKTKRRTEPIQPVQVAQPNSNPASERPEDEYRERLANLARTLYENNRGDAITPCEALLVKLIRSYDPANPFTPEFLREELEEFEEHWEFCREVTRTWLRYCPDLRNEVELEREEGITK